MKNITKISILCAFLIAFSALSVNAQSPYCSDPNCPLNNVSISGPARVYYLAVTNYSLPNITGASYNWYAEDFFALAKHENGTGSSAMFTTPHHLYGGSYQWGYTYVDPFTGEEITLPGWYISGIPVAISPGTEIGKVYCTVTYNGHNHYYSKKIIIDIY